MSGDLVVSRLSYTAVKGTRVQEVQQLDLDLTGARGDRRFYVIDDRERMRNGKQIGALQAVVADFAHESGTLSLRFPDRGAVSGAVELGAEVRTRFFSRERDDRLVLGPWSQALSEFTGQPLRLVATDSASAPGRDRAIGPHRLRRHGVDRLAAVPDADRGRRAERSCRGRLDRHSRPSR
jgi:uncharacterized protein YcbX